MKTLICIYSSHEDVSLAEDLRKKIKDAVDSEVFDVIIVLSEENLEEDFKYNFSDKILYLKVKECYTRLSIKTESMINACNQIFEFDYLVKWDASTMVPERCYSQSDRADNCLRMLKQGKFKGQDYHSHLNASCNGRKSVRWFKQTKKQFLEIIKKEGRDLNAHEYMPNNVKYFRGKFYILSKKFCNFISNSEKCREVFEKNFQHNFGNEDMSVGQCHEHFKNIYDK